MGCRTPWTPVWVSQLWLLSASGRGVVHYVLDASVDAHLESQIYKGIEHYHKYTCLRFVKRTTEKDYIRVMKPQSGCNSMVGVMGGEQILNMGDGCQYVGLVLHEFGHAIGYFHEHNRPDRDNTINVLWDNVQPWFKDAFKKYQFSEANTQGLPYDLTSIMHYENTAFAKAGFCKTTITVKSDPTYEISPVYLREFSPQDIKKINMLYGCTTNQLPPVVLPGTGNPDPNACVCEDKYKDRCPGWASSGECSNNNAWMSNNCPKSCRTCGEPDSDCKDEFPVACNDWGLQSECTNNPQWMNDNCAKTCGACGTGVPPTEDPNLCEDKYPKCSSWASTGECSANFQWMHQNCKKSCRVCGEPQTDCMDNFPQACQDWQKVGECAKNPIWMKDNCKKTCNACNGGGSGTTVAPPQTTVSPGTPVPPTDDPDCTTETPDTQPPTQPPVTQPPDTPVPPTQPPVTDAPAHCKDIYSDCPEWKGWGWCNDGGHDEYMKSVCKRTCDYCGGTTKAPDTQPPTQPPVTQPPDTPVPPTQPPVTDAPANCKDTYSGCPKWKGYGWCNDGDHDKYMEEVCRKTCGYCGGGSGNCKDVYPSECPKYKEWGFCTDPKYDKYVREVCKFTCNHC
ncbi:zinc metalloproteinase nas-15 isoform X2 [Nematostella vectensis]|uniref:zinc metalloproteinase nas-15 isoform X2 n=1 Tax=Nematostella vectensis TaxID=45351 RepID=UPI00207775E2|nr:zinc metalloproteinase nas-15 isoform X2 [Nematostella vectensis]